MLNRLREKLEEIEAHPETFWDEMNEHHKILRTQKKDILIRYNTICKDIHLILEGSFVCYQISESGVKKAVWFFFEDHFTCAASPDSFFTGVPTKYEIEALEPSIVVKLPQDIIDSWVLKFPSFNRLFIKNIIKDFVTIYEARSCLLTYNSEEFLNYVSQKFPFLLDKLPAYLIADFMGISPEWYSKLKKKLTS